MYIEFAHYLLILSMFFNILQMVFAYIGANKNNFYIINKVVFITKLNTIFVLTSFTLLVFSFLRDDFSVSLVFHNSQIQLSSFYKISSLWANHNGSQFLWVLIISLYSFSIAYSKVIAFKQKSYALFFMGVLYCCFSLYLILTSSPFTRYLSTLGDGLGLNPILQDVNLAIHPPILYFGYVGCGAIFSLIMAGVWSNGLNKHYLYIIRPWIMFSFIMLLVGSIIGAIWAYLNIGWGGFWFWDAVENSALLPLLSLLGLLHSSSVFIRYKNIWSGWVITFCLLAFILSILGTFLVRSGIISSVHSFATNPTKGVFILSILSFFCILSFIIVFTRYQKINVNKTKQNNKLIALNIFNVILIALILIVLVGTIYPPLIYLIDDYKLTVGAGFFNNTVAPLFAFSSILLIITHKINYKILLILFFALLFVFVFIFNDIFVSLVFAINTIVFIYMVLYLIKRRQSQTLNLKYIGRWLIHISMPLFIIGITCVTMFKAEFTSTIKPNQTLIINNTCFNLNSINKQKYSNYSQTKYNFIVLKSGTKKCAKKLFNLSSSINFYEKSKTFVSKGNLKMFFKNNYYITVSNQSKKLMVYIYIQPYFSVLISSLILLIMGLIILFLDCYKNREYIKC